MSKSSMSSGNSGHLECNTGFLPGVDIWKYRHSEKHHKPFFPINLRFKTLVNMG